MSEMTDKRQPGTLETDDIVVRSLQEGDLDTIVTIDAKVGGRRRPKYFDMIVQRALDKPGVQISLMAELDGTPAGFLIATLYYGEYGVTEPTASIDTIGVHPEFQGRQVGRALLRQLRLNMGALRIDTLRTEVSWDEFDLLRFFQREGFRPSARICLERVLDPTDPER
jgi:GNAT superfamily N-acetyltransferase